MRSVFRENLHLRLVRAARVRAGITMLCVLPIAVVVATLPEEWAGPGARAALFFGGVLAVSWALTRFYCRPAVACDNCGKSLWALGTGNFKPRRMKVRKDANECPHCHAPIV